MITPLEFLKDIIGPLANYIDTIFLLFGLFLWLGTAKGWRVQSINKPLYRTIRNSILYLNFSSLIMAFIMEQLHGCCNGRSPFLGIMPMELFYFQYLMMFLYNNRVFQLVDYRTMVRILSKVCVVLLIIGYIQVLAMIGVGTPIYNSLAESIGGFVPTYASLKLPLTASEGAGAGGLIGIFIMPFLLAKYIYGYRRAIIQIVLWLVPLYFTFSTTAYSLFLIDLMLFSFVYLRKLKREGRIHKFLNIAMLSFLVMVAVSLVSVNTSFRNEISYTTFDKSSDLKNGSTVSRMVPFIINWGCFTEMPVAGVGNGLQGYFYSKYFPYEFLDVPGTDLPMFLKRTKEAGVIPNGGTFLPGYMSGYGTLGLIVLCFVISKMRKTFRARSNHFGLFRYMYPIGAIAFLVAAFTSEMYCLYYAWFVLSIPFMYYRNFAARKSGN